MSTIAENIQNIYRIIAETAGKCGRNPKDISLMAVSKTKPMSMLLEAYDAGMRLFGENRVQEAVDKRKELPADAEIQLIGHLQSNKTKLSVGNFSCIQSVDSLKIARKINDQALTLGIVQDILLEVKTSEEEAKSGFSGEALYFDSVKEIMAMENIQVKGLMTIAPFVDDEKIIRQSFSQCRLIFEKTKEIYPHAPLSVLSMGMSGDYRIAIEEGATLIRVGSSIFGTRS
ncbi:MAG: YggS family pyridoxal phosphate-dependent enzyme [Spirochaetaceae bacterium]|nr:YggS family pyridoxal phosphate-dependent enzyme [Spirochaetaceae bacterium]